MQFLKSWPITVLIACCFLTFSGYSQDSLVLVNVTVTDPLNRYVSGLQQDHFKMYENGDARPITYFEQKSVPLTMIVLYAPTGGPADVQQQCRSCIRRYLESANAHDEFILVSFEKNTPTVEKASREKPEFDGTSSQGTIKTISELAEAIELNRIRSKVGKKALVLISGSNQEALSRAWDTIEKAWELSEHPEFQTYTVQDLDPTRNSTGKSRTEPQRKRYISSKEEVGYYLDLIYDELRNQYVLGFPAAASKRSLKSLKISVEIHPPRGLPNLKAKTGKGYYSSPP